MRQSAITLQSECSQQERDVLIGILRDNNLSERHLEIGTAAGGTLKEMIGVYIDREIKPKFVVIDPLTYFPNQREKIELNLRNSGLDPSQVDFRVGTSNDFLKAARATETRFDFIFIDGDHRHLPAMIDLQWADMLRSGGFVCLHDYGPKFPGVIWAADYFLRKNPNFRRYAQAGTLLVLAKTGEGQRLAVTPYDLLAARLHNWLYRRTQSIKRLLR
jgi:predicted O-methyltransferase YrrM